MRRGRRGGGGLTTGQESHANAPLMRDALQGANEIGALDILGLVRPLVAELVEHVDVAERTQDAAHEARFADRLLDRLEAGADDGFGAHHARDGARHFAEHVVRSRHGLLARRHGVGELFGGLEAWVDDRDGDHPDAVLHAWREHGHFGEEALVRFTGHDLMRVSFRSTVRSDNGHGWAEEFDKVPAGAGYGEKVGVVADVTL